MIFQNEQFEIEVVNEAAWLNLPNNISQQYCKDYLLGENNQNANRYYIVLKNRDGLTNSCRVLVNGGTTEVNIHSVVLMKNILYLAIGDSICGFEIPSLNIKWHHKVDVATCFGVYVSPDSKGILSHGELEIAKISFDGEMLWRVGGKDIFTEDFTIFSDHIEVTDFNYEKYRVIISNGKISLQSNRG